MRVVIVSRIYRPEPSAASLFLGSVADSLVTAGHEVEVLTAKPPPGLDDRTQGERVRTFPVLRDSSGYVRGYLQYMSFDLPLTVRLLFTRRPDVVFVEPPPTTGAVVRVICSLRRIPYVYDAADIWSDAAGHATNSALVIRVLRAIERFAIRGATELVTISQGVVGRLRDLDIRLPATVTGFGADTSVFRYTEESVKPYFIYAGTYTGLHGAEILIDAFAEFSATHEGYRLRFIGNGTGQAEMRERARDLEIDQAVDFAEPVTASDLQPLLARSIASLATLHPDGGYEYAFTSKIYSSLATGCPVIFAGPGPTSLFINEARRNNPVGTAVEYDASAIAAAMRVAADQPITPAQRREIATWTAAEHSMQAVAQKVAQVVIRVARDRKSHL